MRVTYQHCAKEGRELEDVYRLQGIEKNHAQEQVPPTQDR